MRPVRCARCGRRCRQARLAPRVRCLGSTRLVARPAAQRPQRRADRSPDGLPDDPSDPPRPGVPHEQQPHPVPPRFQQDAALLVQHRRRPGTAVPDGADRPRSVHRARDRDPRAAARGLQAVAAGAAVARPPARKGLGHTGQDLLQIRRRLARWQPQDQHRRATSLVQRPGRHQEADLRDGGRAMGIVAGLRRQAVRHRRHGVPGAGEPRPEALPPRADGDLRRALHRQPVQRDPVRPHGAGQLARPPRLAGHRDQRGGGVRRRQQLRGGGKTKQRRIVAVEPAACATTAWRRWSATCWS